jgi:TRAP-type transport system large permease protein
MILVGIVFAILVLIGMPIAFAIGISGVVFFLQNPDLPITIPVQLSVSQTQNFALLAIPLFILAGNLMNLSGITKRLLDLASVITGRLRGGLAQVTIALSALMGGVSGSAIADAAMQSRMLGPEMLRRGMTRGFAAGILSYSSVLTPIIPPGIGFIIYGTIGQVSIGRLFAAGFVPAALLWIALSLAVTYTARKRGYPPERDKRPTLGETVSAFRGGAWALMFPVLLLAGLRAGVFTPSEIGAVAVVYALFVGVIVHREMGRKELAESLDGSVADVGGTMFLIALSAIFAYGIVYERVPDNISQWMLGLGGDLTAVMAMIVVFLLIAGFFVDATVLIIILTPIFLPLIRDLGGDPVHFGVVFIVAATIGNFTPPVGAAMYAVCAVLKCPIGEYARESVPFLIAVSAVAFALIFIPGIVLFVPNALFGAF